MGRPSLHDVLKKKEMAASKHIALNLKDAKALFCDLPKEHKFWLKNGSEVNNLSELYKALIEIDTKTFNHHVTKTKNDFAVWVGSALADTVLSRRLQRSKTKIDHVEFIKERIDELKGSGTRIPAPGKLTPDFSFIETKKEAPRPRDVNLEKRFKLKGVELTPDGSFLESARPQIMEESKYDKLMDSQKAVVATVQRDIRQQEIVDIDLQDIGKDMEIFGNQINVMKNEITGIKSEIHNQRIQTNELEQAQILHLQETIKEMRDKEMKILKELGSLTSSEKELSNKNKLLLTKANELAKKEQGLLEREKKYNSNLKKYTEMIGKTEEKLVKDEQRIQHLLSSEEKTIATTKQDKSAGRINDLLKETKVLKDKKKFSQARKNLAEVRTLIDSHIENEEEKKTFYYLVFELETDIDLESK